MSYEGRRVAFAAMAAALGELSIEDRQVLAKNFASAFRADIERAKPYVKLPVRQLEVLQLLADGLSAKETANTMGIGARTVQTHVLTMREKLGAVNVSQLIAEAFRRGILT